MDVQDRAGGDVARVQDEATQTGRTSDVERSGPERSGSDGREAGSGEDPRALVTAELEAARRRIEALDAQVRAQALERRVRDAMEDAGAVRVGDAVRAALAAVGGDGGGGGGEESGEAEIGSAVQRVRAAHPEYFGGSRWPTTNAATERGDGSGHEEMAALAARARASNDRRALLDYLRARRAR